MKATQDKLRRALAARFADGDAEVDNLSGLETLAGMAGRASCRNFTNKAVAPDLMRTLCAVALSSPSA